MKPKTREIATKIAKIFLVIALFGVLAYKGYISWNQLHDYKFTLDYSYLAIALLFAVIVYGLTVFGYHLILREMGMRLPLKLVGKVRIVTDMAGYIPGKIWSLLGRFYMFGRHAEKKDIVLSTMIEFYLLVLSGLTFTAIIITGWTTNLFGMPDYYRYIAASIIPLSLALIHPAPLKFATNIMLKIFSQKTVNSEMGYAHMLRPFVFYFAYWVASGLMLYFLIKSIYPLPIEFIPEIMGIYAAAWSISVASFIFPSGLGIREGLISYLLSFYMPLPIAIIISILLRIILIIIGSLLASLCLFRHNLAEPKNHN